MDSLLKILAHDFLLKQSEGAFLLFLNQPINAEKHYFQIEILKAEINLKHIQLTNRKGVIFHHDNVQAYIFYVCQDK